MSAVKPKHYNLTERQAILEGRMYQIRKLQFKTKTGTLLVSGGACEVGYTIAKEEM